jgi:lipopolysaccharide transport system permease protein
MNSKDNWDLVISSDSKWYQINFKEIWKYRDLIIMFTKRDFQIFYKQTILGPLWFFIQPIFTTLLFILVFSKIAKIPTDGIPSHLFYLSGLIPWMYFSTNLLKTSQTFIENSQIFGKVYFPRLVVPISVVSINLLQFLIQFAVFLLVYLYYLVFNKGEIYISLNILLIPLALFQLVLLSLGFGIFISSVTTKYRDLIFVTQFGVQLWMYISPIVYPTSLVPERYLYIYMLNPISSIIEIFRYSLFSKGVVSIEYILISWSFTIFIFLMGLVFFNKIERSFMDTI